MDREPRGGDQRDPSKSPGKHFTGTAEGWEESQDDGPRDAANRPGENKGHTHSVKTLLRGHTILEWLTLITNILLVLIGAFYTFYAAKQWDAMRSALSQTERSLVMNRQALAINATALEMNRESLDLNRRQTLATEHSANAAGDSVKLGKAAIDSSVRSFQIDQRPYLTAQIPRFVGDVGPTADKQVSTNLTFKNIGKTPATELQVFRRLVVMGPQPSTQALIAVIEKQFSEGYPVKREKTNQDLAPGVDFFTTAEGPTLTKTDVDSLRTAAKVIYVFGAVLYADSFGNQHRTEFSYEFFGDDKNVWHISSVHNVMR